MGELEVKQRYNPQKRTVKLCIDLPNVNTYKVKFEKEDKTNKRRVGMMCNKEYYTEDYTFNSKEPYLLTIDSGFIGNICIEPSGQDTLKFPILEKSKDEITLAVVQPKEASTNNLNDSKKIEEKFTSEDNLTFFETSNEYFKNLGTEVHTITDEMKESFIILFKENKNVMYGVIGDTSQELSSLKNGIWKDIKGLSFYLKEIGGKTYVVLKGFAGLRETLKGTKYLISNPQVGAFAVTAKDMLSMSSILNGTKITIFISSAFSLIDYFTTNEGKADFTDIATNLLTGIGKALIAYWIGTAVTAGIIAGFTAIATVLGATVAVPALIVFAIGATVSVLVGAVLNYFDDKFTWTESLSEKVNELQESFSQKINQIEKDVDNSIYKFFQDFEREFWNWVSASGGATPYDSKYGNW